MKTLAMMLILILIMVFPLIRVCVCLCMSQWLRLLTVRVFMCNRTDVYIHAFLRAETYAILHTRLPKRRDVWKEE